MREKALVLANYKLQWHFTGNIQSNKVKYIAESASWVHSISAAKHALLLNKNRSNNELKLKCGANFEVNISHDTTKHGLINFTEIIELANIINKQENLIFRGLMGMSGVNADLNTKNKQFSELKQFFDKLKSISDFENIDTLSMGMSDDFELAIKNGANMLRIGSLIFGDRKYNTRKLCFPHAQELHQVIVFT